MPRIVFEQVTKRFGAVEVLPPLDLELDDGEFTVLIGPSGCGKSTTLRMLAGLETLSGGEIYFDGRPISKLEPKARDIAMVFQDYALYPHMNIARNMSFALRLSRMPKDEIDAKVKRVAGMLNIGHLLDRKPAELSGGQRQRVAMGRALVRDASTFLFDEPLSNLDAKLRGKMRTELAEMRQTLDKNMVYVTHDQVEAMTLGDRIVVMNEGRIQQQGRPEDLFRRPANIFVAGFIGSPTMNFIPCEISGAGEGAVLRGAGIELPVPAEFVRHAPSAQVTLGVRPSSIHSELSRGPAVEVQVVVAEYLGAQTVLATRLGDGTEILIEQPSGPVYRPGAIARFAIDLSEILIFDRASGKTI